MESDENKVQIKPLVTEGEFESSHKFLNSRIKSPCLYIAVNCFPNNVDWILFRLFFLIEQRATLLYQSHREVVGVEDGRSKSRTMTPESGVRIADSRLWFKPQKHFG